MGDFIRHIIACLGVQPNYHQSSCCQPCCIFGLNDNMQDDLSLHLVKSAIVSSSGMPYADFRKRLTPKWWVVWTQIISAWCTLLLTAAAVSFLSNRYFALDVALVVCGGILTGFTIAFLQLFLHEAAHYKLLPDRRWNDLLCNIFVSGIVGIDVRKYRLIHWDHHRHLGTPMDTEITYFDPLNLRFLVESLLGVRAMRVASGRRKALARQSHGRAVATHSLPRLPGWTLLGGLLANAVIVLTLANLRMWPLLLAWTGGVLVWFPFFGALRQLLEHRDENADPNVDYTKVAHGAIHRLFGHGFVANTLGGAGFNRHLLHHWEPDISCTRLGELEAYLLDTDCAEYLRTRQTTYAKTFRRLFRLAWR